MTMPPMFRFLMVVLVGVLATAGCDSTDTSSTHVNSAEVPEVSEPISRFDIRFVIYSSWDGEFGPNCSTNLATIGKKPATINMTCGYPDTHSRVEVNFAGTDGVADLYECKRHVPQADGAGWTTESKTVRYEGTKVIAFQDEGQMIVLDPREEQGD